MHLAYVIGRYPQPSETFISREIEGLRARGHRVDIFSLFPGTTGPVDGVEYGWRSTSERALRRIRGDAAVRDLSQRWWRRLQDGAYDTVVGHFASLPSTVALEAVGHLPFVLSVHARDLYVEAERLEEKITRAAATVTCTQANVDFLRARFPADAHKIHLIYHGLPPSWLCLTLPRRPRRPNEPLRLLAVGRLVEKKGFHVLLEACAHVQRQGVPFLLRLVGDGPWRRRLAHRIERLQLDTVTIEPWLTQQELTQVYIWADLMCCPSILTADGDRDGLPNVLVEAMCTGLPAVGSRLSGIPEAIEDGVTGLLVPPGDAVALAAAITTSAPLGTRARLGAHAAARVRERFDAEAWLDHLEAILHPHPVHN